MADKIEISSIGKLLRWPFWGEMDCSLTCSIPGILVILPLNASIRIEAMRQFTLKQCVNSH
jgi:hypothetical protein